MVVKAVKKNNALTIVVHDRGRGMTRRQIDQIGPYIQFDRMVYEQQGNGLGLTIAKRLVELHGGRFNIRSVSGEGTLVTIQLKA